jgi:hypothetical protein
MVIITAPHFVAAFDLETGNIAPIIKYMKDWDLEKIYKYCQQKGWEFQLID